MANISSLFEAEIPRLRRYARALTRDAVRADDLVQSCLARAIAKQHLWQEGTDLRAWLFTLLHNQHVNDVRRAAREGTNVPVDEVAAMLPVRSNAIDTLQLRDLHRAMGELPDEQRQVILLVGLEGMRYEQVAQILNIPIGTVRSRLSRGREMLRVLMGMRGETAETPARRQARRHRCAPSATGPDDPGHDQDSQRDRDRLGRRGCMPSPRRRGASRIRGIRNFPPKRSFLQS